MVTKVDNLKDELGKAVVVSGIIGTFKTTLVADTAGAYASGDFIGDDKSKITGAVDGSGSTGIIQSIIVSDLAKQDAPLDIVFFDADPTGTTFTDQDALDIDDADLPKVLGVVSINASDYADFADNSVAIKESIGLAFTAVGTADIFFAVVSRGTPTYISASDLQVTVVILKD